MTLNRIWIQNREMGNIARRMIWIPAVLSLLVIGALAARTPHDEQRPVMAATPIPAEPPVARRRVAGGSAIPSHVSRNAECRRSVGRARSARPCGRRA